MKEKCGKDCVSCEVVKTDRWVKKLRAGSSTSVKCDKARKKIPVSRRKSGELCVSNW